MKKLIVAFIVFLFCFMPTSNWSQIKISESIQGNNLNTSQSNKLYYVDFWATWCGPCVAAKKYLGALQKQFPTDFYVISISDESPERVQKYIDRRPTDLAIAIDYDKQTFKKFDIRSLPTGILFNAEGSVVWEGHPGNLKPKDISQLLRKNVNRIEIDEFILLESYKRETKNKEIILPEEDFELTTTEKDTGILEVGHEGDFISYKGSLRSILAYLVNANDKQIQIRDDISNKYYKLTIKKDSRRAKQLLKHVLKKLKLQMQEQSQTGDVLVLKIEDNKFWDTNQINWGSGNPKYLIGDDQIQADNVTFEDITYRLSNLLEIPVVRDVTNTNKLHDWQIHYKFYELMLSDLSDNFGIKAEKQTQDYPIYIIQKKTP
jgi:thiol-disulfide isomerase/thioredoxin